MGFPFFFYDTEAKLSQEQRDMCSALTRMAGMLRIMKVYRAGGITIDQACELLGLHDSEQMKLFETLDKFANTYSEFESDENHE